jgi:hypothetical protein
MELNDIARIRLCSQQLAGSKIESAQGMVSWMGAMQAQDFGMSKWALGVRLSGSTERKIEEALGRGEILRTHVLRPTWHYVSPEDIHWMLELSAAHIKAMMRFNERALGLDESIYARSNAMLASALHGGKELDRKELMGKLEEAGIDTRDIRPAHLLMRAEIDGIVCSGASRAGRTSYALLAERAPKTKPLSAEQALATLAKRYFTSHCPATLEDFAWWSGLTTGAARGALELVKADFIPEKIDERTYWLTNDFSLPEGEPEQVYLLPAFDEFLVSYTERSASLPTELFKATIPINRLFNPAIVVDGRVIGLWKRTVKKERVIVETEFFNPPQAGIRERVEEAAGRFGRFLGKDTEFRILD